MTRLGQSWQVRASPGMARRNKTRLFFHKGLTMKFQKCADTKILESVLAESKIGDKITYEVLSKALGRDVRKFALNALRSARSCLLREKNMVFSVEDNVGLIRLNDSQIVASSDSDRQRISRTAKRTLLKLSAVKFDGLEENDKRKHVAYSAQLGAIAMFATKTSTNRIESQVTNDAKALPIGDTLKLFTT
jgi:hypothetical protein